MKVVNILGTTYTIYEDVPEKDMCEGCDGCTDHSMKRIKIAEMIEDKDSLGNLGVYKNQVLRHEIIHAFLFESGLGANFEHPRLGHEETVVDWLAFQFPKILRAFEEAECI